jgi:ribosomal protein S18 acetylase RimI-like enzyme
MACEPFWIAPVAPDRRDAALHFLFSNVAEPERTRLIREFLASHESRPVVGLLEAGRNESVVGVVCAQPQPGATAALWPPVLIHEGDELVARALIDAACGFLAGQGVTCIQAVLENKNDPHARRLTAAGFQFMADLTYMLCMEMHFPRLSPADQLQFHGFFEPTDDRLAHIVLETYEQTLDCPRLNGVRSVQDVLAGYRATGVFNPALWLIARHGERDVGCLILADHSRSEQMEILYMGLIPSARGRGWGIELVRYAQWLAHGARRTRLLLAVDTENIPAMATYQRAGFLAWAQRSVFMRTMPP